MAEKHPHIDPIALISRYLSGNATDEEVRQLEQWVLASAENKRQFKAIKESWVLAGMKKDTAKVDVEQEWKTLNQQLFTSGKVVSLKPREKSNSFMRWSIAAAVAVLAAVSIWVFFSPGQNGLQELATLDQVDDYQLPDGTEISLNQYSSIKYHPEWQGKYRRVELQGDAFFEVTRDENHPFVISAGKVEVEVLGTAFYVDSRSSAAEIQVIVKSGTVAVSAGQERIVLQANETGIYEKATSQLLKKESRDNNYLAWKNKTLEFSESTLEEVIFALNRQFYAQISLENEALKTCTLTATYKDKSLEAIVKIIEKTLDIQSRKEGEKIIFFGKGCD